MSRFVALLFALCLLAPTSAKAQNLDDLDRFGIWTAAFFTGQRKAETPALAGWLDLHARRDPIGTTAIIRPGIGLRYKAWGSVWVGYGYVPVWTDFLANEGVHEHRIWEQFIFGTSPGKFLWQSRTRIEQRFLAGEPATAHRIRQFVRLNYAITNKIGIAFWDELFLGVVDGGWAKQGFDQNRTFVGLAVYDRDAPVRTEVGYAAVFVSRDTSALTHVLAVNLFWSPKGKGRATEPSHQ